MSSNKQLLGEVFVISGIIKVEVGVISRSRDLDYCVQDATRQP